MLMKFFVYRLKAEVSDATKVRSSAMPITRGEPLHATTSSSGVSEQMMASPQLPSHRSNARSVASLSEILFSLPSS
jgi:hypothetical protein